MEFDRVFFYFFMFSDNEGNIFFNEMLYACMKKAYGTNLFLNQRLLGIF